MERGMARMISKAKALEVCVFTAALLTGTGCKKETELIPGNQAPDYAGVPTVITQNYVNRLFIDLIGREPLNVEMDAEVAALEAATLSIGSREALVNKLMTSTAYVEGDSSYKRAYYQRQYELYKSRCLEGASDDIIDGAIGIAEQDALADSLAGNTQGLGEANSELQRLRNLKNSRVNYMNGLIGIDEVMGYMVFNSIYDQINMNTFNFINATFDNLLLRYPTNAEFNTGFSMVENNAPGILFTQSGQNKGDYVQILTGTTEFEEGMVRWSYNTFMGREASTYEVYTAMSSFHTDLDLQRMQRTILVSDEYANIN
ncbi:MAG: hypothetical protein IPG74_13535 [Flavobacteriales bacterium]|nr:hypothetical protein [Flavobacteriales bacterium]